jgi:hypothetical protein
MNTSFFEKRKKLWICVAVLLFIIGYCEFDLLQNAMNGSFLFLGFILIACSVYLLFVALAPKPNPEDPGIYFRFRVKFFVPVVLVMIFLITHIGYLRMSLLNKRHSTMTCLIRETYYAGFEVDDYRGAPAVRYTLNHAGKQYHMAQMSVLHNDFISGLSKGDSVTVWYLPELPYIAEIVGIKPRR